MAKLLPPALYTYPSAEQGRKALGGFLPFTLWDYAGTALAALLLLTAVS